MKLLFGDIHNHCGMTYGYGSLEHALAAAREQLDFCMVTGHAMWPDIPERTPERAFLVDYHKAGFAKLKARWEEICAIVAAAAAEGFITFQGYEMHSSHYGDYHLLSTDNLLPLIDSTSPKNLLENVSPSPGIVIPHHMGYTPGYRGINWDEFDETISPVVEVYSKHGCGMSDGAPYPYYHTMGPRDGRSTAWEGLRRGYKFGFVASTDHHAGYPGSYGDGRAAVWAEEATKEAVWDAILQRRTYAVTGDKIRCQFSVNGAPMGSEITADARDIDINVEACDFIDSVTLYKNLKPLYVFHQPESAETEGNYKIRIELGWGKNTEEGYLWECAACVRGGKFLDAEPCFRGRNVLSPAEKDKADDDVNNLRNHIAVCSDNSVEFTAETFKNPSSTVPATAAVNLTVSGSPKTALSLEVNGRQMNVTVGELLESSRSMHMDSYNSHACLVHQAVPDTAYRFQANVKDTPQTAHDVYYVEVRQKNEQYAWVSPVFVNKK